MCVFIGLVDAVLAIFFLLIQGDSDRVVWLVGAVASLLSPAVSGTFPTDRGLLRCGC